MRSWLPVLSLLSVAAAATPACARDLTKLAVLGFAQDGSAFAFEQFGWQNAASMPYSELTIVITATGTIAAGSPYTAAIVDGRATQASARSMSYTAARKALTDLRIGDPGTIVAKASGDPNDPSALQASFDAPGLGRLTVKLETAVVKSVGCDATGVKVKALAIRLLDDKGTALRTIFKEKNPPAERQCPTGYALTEIRLLPRAGAPPALAMIVGMDRPRLGGTDRRYLGFVADLALPARAEAAESSH